MPWCPDSFEDLCREARRISRKFSASPSVAGAHLDQVGMWKKLCENRGLAEESSSYERVMRM